ncbi:MULTISPECIES: trigger factor [Pseudoxanthomonas]|jgi:trigger factor|uniref:trigger factor n=1 Tax=Pseudoxanthomonas TaxID=83618 RepID=UPI001618A36B|nr:MULTISPECIES: trigger factor [Pseudoxanthomonas]MBB3274894.1 trigger factor [Pseudoxanthomonas sp. OG2]MBD9378276.1 trigger factor [Pseudoxanthomonas sp. PXM04]MBV7475214.1 trigger factor [Pseudoxanthomonas sp. PXM05]
MQVSVESVGNLERRMTFSLPAERLDTHIGGRLREIARTARIKGFRPGKVPTKVIEQRFGQQVRAEALDGLLRETFNNAVRDNDLQLAGNPRIEKNGEGELDFIATFEVVPDFGEIDVTKLNVIRHTAEVADADIDQMVENLRLQRRTFEVVQRGAKDGDRVELETWSQAGDERLPAEGAEKGATLIGSGVMFADIEKGLIGLAAGEEKTIQVQFPADWRVPQLAGRQVDVYVKVTEVAESVLPAVDKDFIRSFGVKSGDAEQFRRDIRSNLERELKGALMGRLRREVGEQLIAAWAHVEMPPRLVENEARAMVQQTADQAARNGQQVQIPPNAHEGFMDAARKRVLVGLLVGEVARRNQLRLDPKRLNETLRLIASTYEEPEQVIELYRNDPQLMGGLQSRVMEEQVIDWIAERAQHTEQSLSFQEAIRN